MSTQLTLSQEERQRITSWVQRYKVHKPFQQNASTSKDVSLVLAQQRPQENPHNKFYSLNLNHVTNLKATPPKATPISTEEAKAGEQLLP